MKIKLSIIVLLIAAGASLFAAQPVTFYLVYAYVDGEPVTASDWSSGVHSIEIQLQDSGNWTYSINSGDKSLEGEVTPSELSHFGQNAVVYTLTLPDDSSVEVFYDSSIPDSLIVYTEEAVLSYEVAASR